MNTYKIWARILNAEKSRKKKRQNVTNKRRNSNLHFDPAVHRLQDLSVLYGMDLDQESETLWNCTDKMEAGFERKPVREGSIKKRLEE